MSTETSNPIAPGRLGTPEMALGTDPRTDPRLLAALTPFGLDGNDNPSGITSATPLEERYQHVLNVVEPGNEGLFAGLMEGLPPVPGVEHEERVISGPDGNQIVLYFSRPEGIAGPLPGIVQIHGGAMVFLSAQTPNYGRLRDELAATGMVCIGVEYRTAGGKGGNSPFPAPLNDCAAAVTWVHDHRAELGINSLIVTGDSGGANLALAVAIKANREGRIAEINGVYAVCPYISGAASWDAARRARELPSWVETNGYFYCAENVDTMVSLYDPSGENSANPLAWPYFATDADLRGLPPHVVHVAELDPVRDEGLAYYRKLLHSDVDVIALTLHGVCHVADLMMHKTMPDLTGHTITSIRQFAEHASGRLGGLPAER